MLYMTFTLTGWNNQPLLIIYIVCAESSITFLRMFKDNVTVLILFVLHNESVFAFRCYFYILFNISKMFKHKLILLKICHLRALSFIYICFIK